MRDITHTATRLTFTARCSRAFAASVLLLALSMAVVPAATAADTITVAGNTILKNGKPWIPKGVVLVGLVAPAGRSNGAYLEARNRFKEDEFKSVADYGADLIRFQVSQGGSDPQSAIYSAAYVDEVVHAVRLARSHGLAIIVSMQSELPSGENNPSGLPTESTQRAWRNLAPRFSSDDGVMFELFNEPSKIRGQRGPQPTWADWQDAHQPIIDQIRRGGAHNALIVEGLDWGATLQGAPDLSDPDSDLIYAVHPYPRAGKYLSSMDWDAEFGHFAESHPVLVTEWNIRANQSCESDLPQVAAEFLGYAKAHNIGVVGWAYDFPGTLVNASGSPTDYRGFHCGMTEPTGAGALLHDFFLQH